MASFSGCQHAFPVSAFIGANSVMSAARRTDHRPWAVFLIFLRLGLSSFGGPVAHLGYFHAEFVVRRQWLSEHGYADLLALCQFLPGPASSQVGIALGFFRAGYPGALAAWAGFTLPSALAMFLFAHGLASYGELLAGGLLQGLKVVAVAVVAQALWGMACKLCPDLTRISIMTATACLVLLLPSVWAQAGSLVLAALAGLLLLKPPPATAHEPLGSGLRRPTEGFWDVFWGVFWGVFWLALFALLLIGLPLLSTLFPSPLLALIDAFYRSGALVFGGGHVVLPLLQAEVVASGWVDKDHFLAGYGVAQALPGPLFAFAAFLGAIMQTPPAGAIGALVCLLAIFMPSFLLVFGALPFWARLRGDVRTRAALSGVNAAVVGLLLAAFYQPVWLSAIHAPQDFAFALLALVALMFWKLPPWLVVLASAGAGGLLSLSG